MGRGINLASLTFLGFIRVPLLILIVCYLIFEILNYFNYSSELMQKVILFILIGVCLDREILWVQRTYKYIRDFNKDADETHYTVSPTSVSIDLHNNHSIYEWEQFDSVKEKGNFFLLGKPEGSIMILYKNFLSDEQILKIRKILRNSPIANKNLNYE